MVSSAIGTSGKKVVTWAICVWCVGESACFPQEKVEKVQQEKKSAVISKAEKM